MRFALRKPCKDCPFRNDREYPFFYNAERAEEVLDGMDYRVFPCHKTAPFNEDGEKTLVDKTQACVGALIMMKRSGVYSAIMQVLSRLGQANDDHLDLDSPVWATPMEFIEEHEKFGTRNVSVASKSERRGKWWWQH